MRKLQFFVLVATVLLLSACSSGGSDSPSDNNAHPESWFSTHKPEAVDPYDECKQCHGLDLTGSGDAVSCYNCHSYNTMPPFFTHPTSWADSYVDHRGYATTNSADSCKACHGSTLQGYQVAPSCFSASYNELNCHPGGPGEAPHDLGESYRNGGHGLEAKADLTFCQDCHGEPGGPGTSPRFNLGIDGNGCEGCHGNLVTGYGHPEGWTGHYTADNIQKACTLCHGVNLDGIDLDGTVHDGRNCFLCHITNPGENPSGCISCHSVPPDGVIPTSESPNLQGGHIRGGHSVLIATVPEDTCDRCHNGAGTGSDKHYDTDRPADVIFSNDLDTIIWDESNMTCNGNCHLNDQFDVPHNNDKWY